MKKLRAKIYGRALLFFLFFLTSGLRPGFGSSAPQGRPSKFSLFGQTGPLGVGLGFSWLPQSHVLLSLGSGYAGSALSLGLEGRYLLLTGPARPYVAVGYVHYFISGDNGGGGLDALYGGPGFEYAFKGGWAASVGVNYAKGIASSGNAAAYSLSNDLLSSQTMVLITQFEVRKYW